MRTERNRTANQPVKIPRRFYNAVDNLFKELQGSRFFIEASRLEPHPDWDTTPLKKLLTVAAPGNLFIEPFKGWSAAPRPAETRDCIPVAVDIAAALSRRIKAGTGPGEILDDRSADFPGATAKLQSAAHELALAAYDMADQAARLEAARRTADRLPCTTDSLREGLERSLDESLAYLHGRNHRARLNTPPGEEEKAHRRKAAAHAARVNGIRRAVAAIVTIVESHPEDPFYPAVSRGLTYVQSHPLLAEKSSFHTTSDEPKPPRVQFDAGFPEPAAPVRRRFLMTCCEALVDMAVAAAVATLVTDDDASPEDATRDSPPTDPIRHFADSQVIAFLQIVRDPLPRESSPLRQALQDAAVALEAACDLEEISVTEDGVSQYNPFLHWINQERSTAFPRDRIILLRSRGYRFTGDVIRKAEVDVSAGRAVQQSGGQ
ncbi:hypothetical protein JW905_16780 [bacterium]|nr:hypothetical protein [candidate division CSSED10-310 bacterium]